MCTWVVFNIVEPLQIFSKLSFIHWTHQCNTQHFKASLIEHLKKEEIFQSPKIGHHFWPLLWYLVSCWSRLIIGWSISRHDPRVGLLRSKMINQLGSTINQLLFQTQHYCRLFSYTTLQILGKKLWWYHDILRLHQLIVFNLYHFIALSYYRLLCGYCGSLSAVILHQSY